MESRIEPATYTLQLNDPIDAICSDVDFNRVAIIQRCIRREQPSKINISELYIKNKEQLLSGNATSTITILEIKNEKLKVGPSLHISLGKYKQTSPSSIAWSHIDG